VIKAQALEDFISEFTSTLEDATTQPKDALKHALAEPALSNKDF
jgi:hypothetical protein